MIDENGRLFGKVNIVDLLIVIIILAAAAFLGYKLLGPESTAANTQKVLVTLYCEETPNYVTRSAPHTPGVAAPPGHRSARPRSGPALPPGSLLGSPVGSSVESHAGVPAGNVSARFGPHPAR